MEEKNTNFQIRLSIRSKFLRISIACLILSFLGVNAYAQQSGATITGKVIDESKDPIIGATVAVKGSSNGTMADLDGAFTLKNVANNATLVISYLGYTTQEVKVGDKKVFNIELNEDSKMLDEVVVEVGYGGIKRANLLGAVSNMTNQDIKDIPAASLSETLYGKLPGVHLSTNNGTPGTTPTLKIRQSSSYYLPQNPIFIIDGIDRGGDQSFFDAIDPNDVESISVLKDASAAVYGARGVGGVFLVTTKRGKEGKPKLSYSGSVGISDRTSFPELMSGQELMAFVNDSYDTAYERNTSAYMNMTQEQFRTSAPTVYNPNSNIDNRGYYFTNEELAEAARRDYNWLDKYWSSSTTTKHNLNLSGGTKDISYYTSLSYYQQDGNIASFDIKQYSFRVGVDAKLIGGLTGKFNIDTSTKNKKLPYNRADPSDGTMKSSFQSLMRTPTWMPYELDGYLTTYEKLPEGKDNTISHVGGIGDSYSTARSINTTYRIAFDYDFSDIAALKGLKATATYVYSEGTNRSRYYRKDYKLYALDQFYPGSKIPSETAFAYENGEKKTENVSNGDRISFDSSGSRSQQINFGLNYNRAFGQHDLGIMLNYEERTGKGDAFSMFKEGMLVPNWEVISAFGNTIEGGNSYNQAARRAYIGRLNYNYSGRYLLETSFRYEASNQFPKDSQWGFFPAAAAGWRVSEESWYKNAIEFIDDAKIRASVGLVGEDSGLDNQWNYLYERTNGGYLGGNILEGIKPYLSGIKESKLGWESTFFQNYGVDLRFFGKLSVGFDYWFKNTWQGLTKSTSNYPTTTGVDDAPMRNYNRSRAWGYDLSVNYNGRINTDMKYRVGVNLSWSDTWVTKVIQNQDLIGTWLDQQGRRKDSGIEGYKCLGIMRTQEQLDAWMAKYPDYKVFGKDLQLGMLYYEPKEGQKEIVEGTSGMVRLKERSSNPYSLGFNLGFSWKSLDFTAQFTGSFGGWKLMNKNDYAYPTSSANGLKMWADHWTLENPDASMPRASMAGVGVTDKLVASNFWLKRGTELRLRNVSVSYTLPREMIMKTGLSTARLYVTATNLFTLISPYDYKDPSLSYFDSYPIMRTINFGLNVSF